jgi:hypothetical protein
MPIREWSEDDRPREKLLKDGEHNRYFSFADEGLIGEYKAVAIREL